MIICDLGAVRAAAVAARSDHQCEESLPHVSEKIMKKAPASRPAAAKLRELREEYSLDYGKAKPNRFATRAAHTPLVVALDEDISSVFSTPEAVKKALRSLIEAMPTESLPKRTTTSRSRRKRGA